MTKILFHIPFKLEIKYSPLTILAQQKPKIGTKLEGPVEILDINVSNAKVHIGRKVKVLNITKLKHFYKNEEANDKHTYFTFVTT